MLPDLATQPLNDVPTSTLQDVVRGLVAVPITGPNASDCRNDLRLRSQAARTERSRRRRAEGARPLGDLRRTGALPERRRRRRHASAAADAAVTPPLSNRRSEPPPAANEAASTPASYPFETASAESAAESTTPLLDRLNGEFAAARELARARREQRQVSVVLFNVCRHTAAECDGRHRSPAADGRSARWSRPFASRISRFAGAATRSSSCSRDWARRCPACGGTGPRRPASRHRPSRRCFCRRRGIGGVGDLHDARDTSPRSRALALEHGHNRVA